MATKYVDNRLTTGLNDGSSPANAWRSLFDCERATVTAGTIIEVVAGGNPYYEATNVNANLRVNATDISFDAATKKITTQGAVGFLGGGTGYNVAGKVLRIQGSQFNDGQVIIASATATQITVDSTCNLVDEAAGNRVRLIDITASNGSGDRHFAWDPGRNGTAGAATHIIWNFNNNEVSAGWDLCDARHKWLPSAAKAGEWYCVRADGSNPALNKPDSATVNTVRDKRGHGNYMCASSGDARHNRGTVGSLSFDGHYGWGNADSLGFSTVYVKAPGDPKALGWKIRVGQLFTNYYQVWGYQTVNDCRFTFGNGFGDGTTQGAAVQMRGLELWFRNCVAMFADGHGFEPVANGPFILEQCIGYWTGHRFFNAGNAACTTTIKSCVDNGGHLFALMGASGTSSQIVTIADCISTNNEAGAIDKKGASSILVERNNLWYPRMTANGGALGYVSPTNWAKTAFTDVPRSRATTETSQATLFDPLFVNVDDTDFDSCDFRLQDASPARGRGSFLDNNRISYVDKYGANFSRVTNIGLDQSVRGRPALVAARAAV